MKSWDELRTALYVHELGTVSAAADLLNVHRATVIRHIDALEDELEHKIFTRHAMGYTATKVGAETLAAAKQAARILDHATRRIRGDTPASEPRELLLSVLPAVSQLVLPGVGLFLDAHPRVKISIESSIEMARIEYGEADLAVRGGPEPSGSGLRCEHLYTAKLGLYAAETYLATRGIPSTDTISENHVVVGPTAESAGPIAAVAKRVLPSGGKRLEVDTVDLALAAALSGIGIAYLPDFIGSQHEELVLVEQTIAPPPENFWLVMHEDSPFYEDARRLAELVKEHCPLPSAGIGQ
ncbi:MAG: LysR family transcriptional regulator [Pseudomonadota bacterium]